MKSITRPAASGIASGVYIAAVNTPQETVRVAEEIFLRSSRRLATALVLGHSAVAALLLYLDIATGWKVAAIVLVCASLIYELRVALRLGANAVIGLRISADDVFSIKPRGGDWRQCEVLGSTYVTAILTVVNLRVAGERRVRSVVILPDGIDADAFRRLRAWLRWRSQAEPA